MPYMIAVSLEMSDDPKYSYAQQLVSYHRQLFIALISLLNEAAKYKDDIVAAYSHVDNILEELDALEKAVPCEYRREDLWSERTNYKTVRFMLSDCCGLPQMPITKDDYEDFLYSYHHRPDLFDGDTGGDDADDNEEGSDCLITYDDYDDYFDKKKLNNIHYYSRGVV